MKKICGIYKITSPNNRVYIGQSRDCEYRSRKYRRLDCKSQPRLYKSIIKHGWDNHRFEVIKVCNEEELDQLEIYYIKEYKSFDTDNGMNLTQGGYSGKPAKESRRKLGEAIKRLYTTGAKERPIGEKNGMWGNGDKLRGAKNGRYGKVPSKETMDKIKKGIKLAWIEKRKNGTATMPEENRRKISEALKGRPGTMLGKKHSEETKMKIGRAHQGKERSEEFRAILREVWRKRKELKQSMALEKWHEEVRA